MAALIRWGIGKNIIDILRNYNVAGCKQEEKGRQDAADVIFNPFLFFYTDALVTLGAFRVVLGCSVAFPYGSMTHRLAFSFCKVGSSPNSYFSLAYGLCRMDGCCKKTKTRFPPHRFGCTCEFPMTNGKSRLHTLSSRTLSLSSL